MLQKWPSYEYTYLHSFNNVYERVQTKMNFNCVWLCQSITYRTMLAVLINVHYAFICIHYTYIIIHS